MVHLVARRGVLLVAAFALSMASGCSTDCRRACEHVLEDCGQDRPGYTVDNCEAECGRFLTHYEDRWEEDNAIASVTCVRQTACEDLKTGTPCYDGAVYVW
jgi:hypothetical protein